MSASPPRPRTARTGRRRFVVAAGAVLVLTTVGAWFLWGGGPQPGDHAPLAICAIDDTTLRADVDADGHLDLVRDPRRDGSSQVVFRRGSDRTTVDVGSARGFWQKLRGASKDDMVTKGAFGDFDGDGHVDLALFYSQAHRGDDPTHHMVAHEVHYGPLARDLRSERTGTVDVVSTTFVYGLRATDQDRDGRSELQMFQSEGDGVVGHYSGVRSGKGGKDGIVMSDERGTWYDMAGWPRYKPGWRDFGVC
ncbi:hypothetical protein [Streptomyces griseus]|uniref:hypothetical protein n=1 Tax=Streptomyces griseus TaxID=1911 RepID=UPI0037882196